MDRVAMTLLQEGRPSPAAPDISQHSRNQRTSKCAKIWKRSWPPETVWIHLDPVLQKLRTGCTEGQRLHIFGDTAAPSVTTPGDLKDHRKHLPGEGGLQPGNNRHCPPISICWPFTKPHRHFESCLLGLFRPYFVSLTKVPEGSCDQNREWRLPSKG